MNKILFFDKSSWKQEVDEINKFFNSFDKKVGSRIIDVLNITD